MTLFIFEHAGVYLAGYSVAVARDEQTARDLLVPILEEHHFNPESLKLVQMLPVDRDIADMVWNGDY